MCVCSFRYEACKAHVPYYIAMQPVWLYHIFPSNLINGMIFKKKKAIEHEMTVVIFPTTSVGKVSYSKQI